MPDIQFKDTYLFASVAPVDTTSDIFFISRLTAELRKGISSRIEAAREVLSEDGQFPNGSAITEEYRESDLFDHYCFFGIKGRQTWREKKKEIERLQPESKSGFPAGAYQFTLDDLGYEDTKRKLKVRSGQTSLLGPDGAASELEGSEQEEDIVHPLERDPEKAPLDTRAFSPSIRKLRFMERGFSLVIELNGEHLEDHDWGTWKKFRVGPFSWR